MSGSSLDATIEKMIEKAADRAADRAVGRYIERTEAARAPLTAQQAADRYCDGSLSKWRDMRFRWPALDEAAAIGPPGKGRRWDPSKLATTFATLSPQMRRRRAVTPG